MKQTNAGLGFKTQYEITVIDKDSGQEIGDPIRVDNTVLKQGLYNLGNVIAYTGLAVGSLNDPTLPEDTGLHQEIGRVLFDKNDVTHTIVRSDNGDLISTVARTVVLKEFSFAENSRTLTIGEIGLIDTTRAIIDPAIEITKSNWLRVKVLIHYTYYSMNTALEFSETKQIEGEEYTFTAANGYVYPAEWFGPASFNNQTTGDIHRVNIEPFITNGMPLNDTGRGWGLTGSVTSYLWDGTDAGLNNRNYGNDLNITPKATLRQELGLWDFEYTIKRNVPGYHVIRGFIIRDTVNGGGFKVSFNQPLRIEEDSSVRLHLHFVWGEGVPFSGTVIDPVSDQPQPLY